MALPVAWRRALRRACAPAVQAAWAALCDVGILTIEHPRARRFAAFGPNSLIGFPPGTIYNEHAIAIGDATMIGPWTSLSAGIAPGQEFVAMPVVTIGDRCVIGRGSNIVGHFHIEIGDDVMTGPYVYITDQNHGYEDPDVPVGRQWPVDKGVSIGAGSWIGTGAVVLPGTVLGRNVVVGAGAVVSGDVPDHSVVAGVPGRILRHYEKGEGWVRSSERPGRLGTVGEPT